MLASVIFTWERLKTQLQKHAIKRSNGKGDPQDRINLPIQNYAFSIIFSNPYMSPYTGYALQGMLEML